ncbi:MAG: protein kinase [Candidatus Schekmanbacteria bacterium]|nr:protein kinase [Candidatus Schekmanbacteria bacterium]
MESPSELQTGSIVGGYRLLDQLGAGGMAVVYRAAPLAGGGPDVALKLVRTLEEPVLASIRREIRALSRIAHPGVVRILDQGTLSRLAWFAMELIAGATLQAHARKLWGQCGIGAGRAVSEAPSIAPILAPLLTLAHRICAPLAYIHGEGIVHRDLKPGNILVRPDGDPVLVDFGLIGHWGGEMNREVLDSGVVAGGTMLYMAPEQIDGQLADARTDLYAFGCILYELVTGRPPFTDRQPMALLVKHLSAAPVPPSRRVTGLPRELEELILRLLAKKPRDRPGYVEDAARVLRRLGAAPPVSLPATPPPRTYLYRPSLIGRGPVLDQLDERLRHAAGGAGAIICVGGASGVGKTRLAAEATRLARHRGLRVITATCAEARGGDRDPVAVRESALHPLRPLLRAVAAACFEGAARETERLLGTWGKVLAAYEPDLDEAPGIEAQPEPTLLPHDLARARLFTCLARTMSAFATTLPVFLVIDDLHWADELTLGFLRTLAATGRLRDVPMIVLGMYRSDEASDLLMSLVAKAGEASLELPPLDVSGVGAVVSEMLALDRPPQVFVDFLSRQSGGNPFFVAEYLRVAVGEKLLRRDAVGVWHVTAEGEQEGGTSFARLPLPDSLWEILRRRLEGLPSAAERLAAGAAVAGEDVSTELLYALARAGASADDELLDGVTELLARQLFQEPAPGVYRFAHAKLRQAVYERLAEAERALLHRRTAGALEAGDPGQRDRRTESLAYHWAKAGEPEKAKVYYLAAARAAAARYALAQSEQLYRAYLQTATAADCERVAARNELAQRVLAATGRFDDAARELNTALAEAESLGDLAGCADSLRGLARGHWIAGDSRRAARLCREALELYRRLGDARQEGVVLSSLGIINYQRGQSRQAQRLWTQALEIHRAVGDRRNEGIALANLARAAADGGDQPAAIALYEQALLIHRAEADRIAEAAAMGDLALLLRRDGQLARAEKLLRDALAMHREVSNRRSEAIVLLNLGDVCRDAARRGAAQALYEDALAINREIGNRHVAVVALCHWARLERWGGAEPHRPDELVMRAEELLKDGGDVVAAALCRCERGHAALALAAAASATEHLAAVEAMVHQLDVGRHSELGQAAARLRRAVLGSSKGRPLFAGEALADIPAAWRAELEPVTK